MKILSLILGLWVLTSKYLSSESKKQITVPLKRKTGSDAYFSLSKYHPVHKISTTHFHASPHKIHKYHVKTPNVLRQKYRPKHHPFRKLCKKLPKPFLRPIICHQSVLQNQFKTIPSKLPSETPPPSLLPNQVAIRVLYEPISISVTDPTTNVFSITNEPHTLSVAASTAKVTAATSDAETTTEIALDAGNRQVAPTKTEIIPAATTKQEAIPNTVKESEAPGSAAERESTPETTPGPKPIPQNNVDLNMNPEAILVISTKLHAAPEITHKPKTTSESTVKSEALPTTVCKLPTTQETSPELKTSPEILTRHKTSLESSVKLKNTPLTTSEAETTPEITMELKLSPENTTVPADTPITIIKHKTTAATTVTPHITIVGSELYSPHTINTAQALTTSTSNTSPAIPYRRRTPRFRYKTPTAKSHFPKIMDFLASQFKSFLLKGLD